jgi:hypothetical protein
VYGGRTRLVVDSEPGDPVGGGKHWSYTTRDHYFNVGDVPYGVGVALQGGAAPYWHARFLRPGGGRLRPGHYSAQRYPNDGVHAPMEISNNDDECEDEASGAFTVKQASYWPDGPLRDVSLTFDQRCDGASGGLHGLFEYRAGNQTARAPWLVSKPDHPPVALSGPCARPSDDYVNVIRGTRVGDRIGGSEGSRDRLFGGRGDDRMFGRAEDDCLDGGAGDDRLDGGAGADRLLCGSGHDVAVVTEGDATHGCERVVHAGG